MLQHHERHPGVRGETCEEPFQRVESTSRSTDADNVELGLFASGLASGDDFVRLKMSVQHAAGREHKLFQPSGACRPIG
jgi:hypothetical protein